METRAFEVQAQYAKPVRDFLAEWRSLTVVESRQRWLWMTVSVTFAVTGTTQELDKMSDELDRLLIDMQEIASW